MKKPTRPSANRPITTRSGKVLKVNRSLGERYTAMRQAKALRKVNRLRGLPKSRVKRLLWRLQPRRLANYWFSRDGAIMALKIIGIAIVAMFILTLAVFAYFRKDLKSISDISGSNLGGSISYYDRTGKILLWEDYNAVKRVPVQSQDMSPYIKEATVAVEDKDFYKHRGFDPKGYVRAAVSDVLHHGGTQGGSTITEQLVKLTRDYNENRTLAVKIKELILAVELERTFTKDQILTSYLNVVPYGGVDYGVQAAAADYFQVPANKLTLAQAAFLAAIPKSPAYYSPYSADFDKQAFTYRYDYVLDQMAAQGKISKQQASQAKKVNILAEVHPQQTKYAGIRAPYFVLAARDELNRRFASQSGKVGGWKVTTTLNWAFQQQAEQIVQANLPNVENHLGDEEALDLESTSTGQMLAMVGGTDFNNPDHGQINYAHDVNISPGSSFKPYDYSTLIENNTDVGAGSVLYDSEGPIPGYPCTSGPSGNCARDYDYSYPGPETLRYALGGSRNVPAMKAMLEAVPNDTSPSRTTSINKVISTADSLMDYPDAYHCYKAGIDVSTATKADETQCYTSSAIGDGAYLHLDEHTNGVASLARLGKAVPQTYILSIQNSAGKTFYNFTQPQGSQVVRPDTAYIVDNMLSDPNASYLVGGEKWQHYNGWDTAIKTGTTNDSFDGLMMAWNTQFAVGSWVGYHTRNLAMTGFMEDMTIPMARPMMEYALDSLHKNATNWKEPSDIQHLPAYVMTHKISRNGEIVPSPSTDIYPSWYKQRAVSSQSVTIDKVSGKVATNCTPPLAKQTLGGNAAPNAFSIDEFYPPGHNASNTNSVSTSGAPDDVHSCSDQPPTINLTATDNNDGTYTIAAFVSAGTHPFNSSTYPQFPGTLTFSINGQTVKSVHVTDPSDNVTFKYTPTASGTMTATVTDSVLYSASATASINFTRPQGQITITNVTVNSASWAGGQAGTTYTVTDQNTGDTLCTTSNVSCNYNKNKNVNSGDMIQVSDSSGDTPDTKPVP